MSKTFELFYSTGGHCGPFQSYREAREGAINRMCGNTNEKWIDIVQRGREKLATIRISRNKARPSAALGYGLYLYMSPLDYSGVAI